MRNISVELNVFISSYSKEKNTFKDKYDFFDGSACFLRVKKASKKITGLVFNKEG